MIAEGNNYKGKAITASIGLNKKNTPCVSVSLEIIGGEGSHRIKWDALLTEKAMKYSVKGLRALGWDTDDISDAPRQVVERGLIATVEIEHVKWNDKVFPAVRGVGGYVEAALVPLDARDVGDINKLIKHAAPRVEGDDIPF